MRRAFGLAIAAACLGLGVGFDAHSIADNNSSLSSSPSTETPTPSSTTDAGLLEGDNVLAAADLESALRETVELDSVTQSEGQEALLCQRRALAPVANLDGLVKAAYVSSDSTLVAEEVVMEVGVPAQISTLERTLIRWNDTCGKPSTTRSRRIELGMNSARAWSFSGVGRVPWYTIVVRDGNRLAWLLLSPFEQPADPAALAAVAQRMLDKLAY